MGEKRFDLDDFKLYYDGVFVADLNLKIGQSVLINLLNNYEIENNKLTQKIKNKNEYQRILEAKIRRLKDRIKVLEKYLNGNGGVNMTNDNFLKGKCLSDGNPYINTIPRKWTDSEIEYMLKLKSSGKTIKEICTILERSEASVSVKLKRLKKKDGNYNEKHLTEKVDINKQFVEYIKPNSILDVYARDGNIAYTNYNVISNDIDSSCETTYHMDAFDLLCTLYLDKEKFDIIDLDPYGSAYDCFDFAIKMANKGLCITLGEMGHKRWKRLDYVKLRYGIYELKDFTSDNLIKKIQEIGLRNKKKLNVFAVKDWQNISRVWFTIEPYKETSQWENKKEDN